MSSDRLVGLWLKGYVGERLYRCWRCGRDGLTHDAMYRHWITCAGKREEA